MGGSSEKEITYKKIVILLSFALLVGGIISFHPSIKGVEEENLYLYGILSSEGAVISRVHYKSLLKKSFGGNINFTNVEELREFLMLEEDSVILDKENLNELQYIKIKNKRKFFKFFIDFCLEAFGREPERYKVIKIPLKFINFENNEKDYWKLDYENAEFIYGAYTKEECEKMLNITTESSGNFSN